MAGTTRDARRAESARRILAAAQQEFAERGFEGATIRSIAARAGVDASLVMQHHGSKAALFASAVQLPDDDRQAAAEHLGDVLGGRLGELPPGTRALVRAMLTVPAAEAAMREHLDERVDDLAASLGGEDARLRATLAVSTVLGLTIARHFLHLRAFDGLSPQALAATTDRLTAGPPAAGADPG